MNTHGESQLAVEEALYSRLMAATASGQPLEGVGIHDHVTQGAAYPYLVIGEFFPTDYSDKGTPGMEIIAQLHLWSQAASSKQLKTLQAAVYNLLNNLPLTLVGHVNYLIRFQSAISLQVEQDNLTRHAVLKYRILTTATT